MSGWKSKSKWKDGSHVARDVRGVKQTAGKNSNKIRIPRFPVICVFALPRFRVLWFFSFLHT